MPAKGVGALLKPLIVVRFTLLRLAPAKIQAGARIVADRLAEVKLVTAASASNVAVPGLPMADAEELRDRLVELAESRRAGL